MHATISRYDGVDTTRMNELVSKVNQTFVPQVRELPGFAGYFLIEADNGVLSSLSLFEMPEQADKSTKLVKNWISDENLGRTLPNAPKITSGKVVAQSKGVPALV
jgi:hypothetical protein